MVVTMNIFSNYRTTFVPSQDRVKIQYDARCYANESKKKDGGKKTKDKCVMQKKDYYYYWRYVDFVALLRSDNQYQIGTIDIGRVEDR